jgi:hypothetical protein
MVAVTSLVSTSAGTGIATPTQLAVLGGVLLFSILSALKTSNFNQNRSKGNHLSSFCNLI